MIDRRVFLTRVGASTFIGSLVASVIGTVRYLFPQVFYEPRSIVKLGKPDELLPGTVHFLAEYQVFVEREKDGVSAISGVCPHLGCVVQKTGGGFACPCHGSQFNDKGDVIAGPAPRGLAWLKVGLSVDGRLIVDRSQTVPQGQKFAV